MKKYLRRLFYWVFKGVPEVKVTPLISYVSDSERLRGHRILIIGGTKGVGFQIAKKCQECGGEILIVGRHLDTLERASSELNSCKYYRSDVTDIDSHSQLLAEASNLLGGLPDCLVYNASLYLHEKSISDVTPEGFDRQFSTNLRSPYFLCKNFIERIIESHATSTNILVISSEMGLYCSDVPYGLGKASLNCLIEGLSRRYITKGFRVNALAPGTLSNEALGVNDNDLYRKYCCGKRFIMTEEVAEIAVFLLSDASSCISGVVIPCNQGNHLRCDW